MIHKRLLPLLTALAAMMGLQAQTTVSGTLLKASDKQAVPFANIALLRQADSSFVRGTTSNLQGQFSLPGDTLPSLLRVSAIGFETRWLPVNDSSSAAVDLGTILLNEGATTLDAVDIVARKPLYAADGDKKIYNVSEDPTVQNGTAQDALQNAPGVEVDAEGNITLNGKAVTVYINDRESHFDSIMLRQYIKTLTADQISSIEAIEYPSAKYGGSGPVVNIRTDQKMLRNSYLSFGANGSSRPSLSPFLSYSYANEKMHLNTYLRYSRDSWDDSRDGDGRYFNEDSLLVRDYSYWRKGSSLSHNVNMSVSFSYEFDTMNSLSANLFFNPRWSDNSSSGHYTRRDSVDGAMQDYSYESGYESHGNSAWGYASIDFEHKFNDEGHSLSFSLGGSVWNDNSRSSDFEHYAAQPQLSFDSRNESTSPFIPSPSISVDYSLPYSDDGEFSAGLSYSFDIDRDNSRRDTLSPADNRYHCDALISDSTREASQDASLFLSWRRNFGNFTLRLGGTLNYETSSHAHVGLPEYDTSVSHLTLHPSLLLMYNTESMHSFSFNLSSHTSYPSANRLSRYPDYGTDYWSTGNPNLKPSRSYSLGLSYSKSFTEGHSLGINGNYSWDFDEVSSISVPEYSPFFGRYVSFSKPYNAGDSRDGNIYLYARYRFSAYFTLGLNGGLNDNWYRIMVRPDEWFESHITSWNLRLNARAKLFNLVWLSANAHYRSRSNGWMLSVTEPTWGVDLSASADLFDRMLSIYLNVNDLFNTEQWNHSSINPYMPSTSNTKFQTQYITFGLTLRFGKMELGNSSQEGIQAASSGSARK